MVKKTKLGVENFIERYKKKFSGKNFGLLCNNASLNSNLIHTKTMISESFPNQLKAIFSPQHGFFLDKQDNMIESDDSYDSASKIPIFSLYGKMRKPSKESFDLIDILLVDLQDVGTRVYTYIYTMSYCMELAYQCKKKVIVLDRPNPVGGEKIEGNCLEDDYKSFVGRYNIPMRHSLTIGEAALFFNQFITCDLLVVKMHNWKRNYFYEDTNLEWIMPSPNLPSLSSVYLYPGQVIFEGTNISEGRGTCKPFEFFGAPFLNTKKIANILKDSIKGAHLREIAFEPCFGKWANNLCLGFQIHLQDKKIYNAYESSLKILQAIMMAHPDEFKWNESAYEYEYEKKAIDLILGSRNLRLKLENFEDIETIMASWKEEIQIFEETAKEIYLYE